MARIKDRTARLKVCSLKDFVDKDAQYRFIRKGIYEGWGMIEPKRPSRFNHDGYAIGESGEKISHIVTMNYRPDIEITDAAWIYHERLQSAPAWYKIVSVAQEENSFVFSCRLFEKSDEANEPDNNDTEKMRPVPLADTMRL